MKRQILNGNLADWTETHLRQELDRQVGLLNRRARLGAVSDYQVGEYLSIEERCRTLGKEIQKRKEVAK